MPNSIPNANQKELSLEAIYQQLAAANITLRLTYKKVKNINFRLMPNVLFVSAPKGIDEAYLLAMLNKRLKWALLHHDSIVKAAQNKAEFFPDSQSLSLNDGLLLWGERQHIDLNGRGLTDLYRDELAAIVPSLLEKWQPKTAVADEVRFKKMHSRWGSCNPRAKRVWLSTYLPAYPIDCTEYVFVHELCHILHPNHSRAFWQAVAAAMPDYRHWHNLLAGKNI